MVLDKSWRIAVVECAIKYTNYIWIPSDKNIFHGYDKDGILVNTPDTTYSGKILQNGWWQVNKENRGLPYNWGGYSNIESFVYGIAEGRFAGNVPDDKNNAYSKYTVGLDCAGLLARCWNLSNKLTTIEIPAITSPLESVNELLPGDILLKPGSHVMIFINFTDSTRLFAQIVDATRSTGKVSMRIISVNKYLNYGYKGFRIKESSML